MSDTTERTPVKKVKNAVLFSDGSIRLENVRLSYPHLVEPQEQTTDDGKKTLTYSMQALMPKASHREAKDLCREAITKILAENKLKDVPADKKFIRDGDTLAKEETEGMWVINARERNRPGLRSNKRDPKTGKPMRLDPDRDGNIFYGGAWVSVLIKPWFSSHPKGGKRVSAGVLGVQFVRDDTPFGTGRIRDEDIDDSFDATDVEDDGGFTEDDTDGL